MGRRRRLSLFVLLCQAGLLAVFVVGLAAGRISVVVNAALSFLVTLLPAVLRRDLRIQLSPWQTAFVSLAVFLHAVGMLGPYSNVWWWDHVTHTLSAMVVAGVGYTVVCAADEHSPSVAFSRRRVPVYVFAFTMLMGVVWEGLELGARVVAAALDVPVIWVVYGPTDTAFDMLFNAVGALIVALFGTPYLQDTVEDVREWLDRRAGAGE
ncbi:hypothetical protein [Halobacterium yunchengense]|uniref:hypothetical protein n=1 Tax=Halobacterium yunchengense TaxID=3108497 RepID=UPI00300854BD